MSVAVWKAIHAFVVLRLLETGVTGYRFGTVCAIFGESVRRKSLSRQLSVCIRINFVLDVNLGPEHNHAVFAFRLTGSHRQSYSTQHSFLLLRIPGLFKKNICKGGGGGGRR